MSELLKECDSFWVGLYEGREKKGGKCCSLWPPFHFLWNAVVVCVTNSVYMMFPELVRLHSVLVALTENTTVVRLGLQSRLFKRLLLHLPADLWTGASNMPFAGWLIDCGVTWIHEDLCYPHNTAALPNYTYANNCKEIQTEYLPCESAKTSIQNGLGSCVTATFFVTCWRLLSQQLKRDPFQKSVMIWRRSSHLWNFHSIAGLIGAALVCPRAAAHGAKQPRLFTVKLPKMTPSTKKEESSVMILIVNVAHFPWLK